MGRINTTGSAGTSTSTSTHRGRVRRRRRPGTTLAGVAIAVVALTACGSDDDSSGESAAVPEEAATDLAIAGGDTEAPIEADGTAAPQTGGAAATGLPINDFGRDIIRSVGLTMSTSNVRDTVDAVRDIAVRSGGAVFSSDVTIGDEQDDGSVRGGGQVVVRIPPTDLDSLVRDLDGAGLVTQLSQDSQDVTEQLVDLEIRIRQAETGIERIEQLLEQATVLTDVFTIETELSNRQVELERLRAAERSTEDLVALATVTVQIEYRAPDALESTEADDGIADAFANGWDAFVGVVFALGFVLAVAAPFLLTGAIVLAAAWLIGRRWNRRQAAAREQRRLDADRMGPATRPTPPPPVAAQRRPEPDVTFPNDDGQLGTQRAHGSVIVEAEQNEVTGDDTNPTA